MAESYQEPLVRTELYCHACGKNFVAELDTGISGNHEIFCPWCDHVHYRSVKDGVISEARWSSDSSSVPTVTVQRRSVWKSSVIKAQTSTVSHLLRERWLNRSDYHG